MMKKMIVVGAVFAMSMTVACSSKKPAGTTPVENATPAETTGGDAYGGAAYGTPATEVAPAPEAAPQK